MSGIHYYQRQNGTMDGSESVIIIMMIIIMIIIKFTRLAEGRFVGFLISMDLMTSTAFVETPRQSIS